MRFKAGDIVRVREDLEVGQEYGKNNFSVSMSKLKGEICTINSVIYTNSAYTLTEDRHKFIWTDEMLEPAEEMQPEQVLKEQVQQIAKENERNCDTCKHYEDETDCACNKCEDFGKWEEVERKENTHCNLKQYFESILKVAKFEKIQEEELELYKLKNQKYGDSFGVSVKKYGLISALTRMSDKWNRIENLILNHDDGTDDESIIDSLKDLSNYANMTIIELEDLCK